jgi:DNA-binding GntR family transcriptional regulator
VAAEHTALYEALAARDESRAAASMTEHLAHAWSYVERFLATTDTGYAADPRGDALAH